MPFKNQVLLRKFVDKVILQLFGCVVQACVKVHNTSCGNGKTLSQKLVNKLDGVFVNSYRACLSFSGLCVEYSTGKSKFLSFVYI